MIDTLCRIAGDRVADLIRIALTLPSFSLGIVVRYTHKSVVLDHYCPVDFIAKSIDY
jgi:hypothetical protein